MALRHEFIHHLVAHVSGIFRIAIRGLRPLLLSYRHIHLFKESLKIWLVIFLIWVLLDWNLRTVQDKVIWAIFIILWVVIKFTCLSSIVRLLLYFGILDSLPRRVVLTLRNFAGRHSCGWLHLEFDFFKVIDRAFKSATQHRAWHWFGDILGALIYMVYCLVLVQVLVAHETLYFVGLLRNRILG